MPVWSDRTELTDSIDAFLRWRRRLVTVEQREAIVTYAISNNACVMHAAAQVLDECCHCVNCRPMERT